VQARLRDTLYGTVVIELMAVQDLFMAPLLAIPTALSHIVWQQTPTQLVVTLGSYGVGIATVNAILEHRCLSYARLAFNLIY